jgi:putative heme-binding domain-containing protein
MFLPRSKGVLLGIGILLGATFLGIALLTAQVFAAGGQRAGSAFQREWRLLAHSLLKRSETYRTAGKLIYEQHCMNCHGESGRGGRGPILTQPSSQAAMTDRDLMRIIKVGVPATEMPGFERWLQDDEILKLIAYVKQLEEQPFSPAPGDRQKGELLFRGKGSCLECHFVAGKGGGIGPELTGIGRRRGTTFLREKLLDPSKHVAEQFQIVRIRTPSGESISGVTVNEDSFSIQIRTASGRLHSFLKSEVENYSREPKGTYMPSYSAVFTESELEDLLAYLTHL